MVKAGNRQTGEEMISVDSLIGLQSNIWILAGLIFAAVVIAIIMVQSTANKKEDKKDGQNNNS